MNKIEYYKQFEENQKRNRKMKKELFNSYRLALNNALDIRKFEIELYWKRSSYFWAINALMIGGYFSLDSTKHFFICFIACIGMMFSTGWYLTNRSSKYWQRNWEIHVDLLEDKVYGPLYKINIDPFQFPFWRLSQTYRISVSRVNQILSLYVVLIWILLCISNLFGEVKNEYILFVITLLFFIYLIIGARYKKHTPKINAKLILREYE